METRLTKKAFYERLAHLLERTGWTRLPGSRETSALFGKREADLILTLGAFESQRQQGRITAELALAGHTFLSMSFPDAPRARHRVGFFLNPDERSVLLDPEYQSPGISDAWWIGRTAENAEKMARAVDLAEPRFLGQPGLIDEIARSQRHGEYMAKLAAVARVPVTETHRGKSAPPMSWVDEAFQLLADSSPRRRQAFANEVATDAWRTYRLLP